MKRIPCAVLLRPIVLVLTLSAVSLGTVGVGAASKDLEAQAREIEGKIMAPCCRANTVAEHYSPIAADIRQEIRVMLREGKDADQILAHYAKEYGDQVLAMPAAKGFNLVAWLVPFLFLIFGPMLIFLVLRNWKSKEPPAKAPATEPAVPIDPKYAERLRQQLAELD